MAEFEQEIIKGIREGQLPPIEGGDGRREPSLSKAAAKRIIEAGNEARRIEVALDVAASGHGYSRSVRGPRRGR